MNGIHSFRPRRVVPRPAWSRGWLAVAGLLLACGLLGVAVAWMTREARAQEVERFSPVARGTRPSVVRWRPLLEEYAWDVETALRVLDCESEGDPLAVNPTSGALGLMQLYGWSRLARRLTGVWDVTVPWVNIRTAYELWEDSGGRFGWHWYASRGCWG